MSEVNPDSLWSPVNTRGSKEPSILVVGLGNPILGDDGVGWRVAEAVRQELEHKNTRAKDERGEGDTHTVEVACLSLGGLSLMEHLIGYQKVIIIDAIDSGEYPKGKVRVFSLADLVNPIQGHTTSAHDTSLQTAIEVGRMMGAEITDDIMVVSVESSEVYEFSDELSSSTAAAVPTAVNAVLGLLSINQNQLI